MSILNDLHKAETDLLSEAAPLANNGPQYTNKMLFQIVVQLNLMSTKLNILIEALKPKNYVIPDEERELISKEKHIPGVVTPFGEPLEKKRRRRFKNKNG